MGKFGWAALCAAGVVACAGQATASITYIWSGTVSGGSDTYNLFGASGGDLAGQSFTGSYTFDPTLMVTDGSGSAAVTVRGGAQWGMPNPGTASLEIGDVTRAMTSSKITEIILASYNWSPNSPPLYDLLTGFVAGGLPYGLPLEGYLTMEAFDVPEGVLPLDLATSFSGNPCVGAGCFGEFRYSPDGLINSAEILHFSIDHLAISSDPGTTLAGPDPSAVRAPVVPEPSTWAMMLLGVVGLGTVLRQRRTFASAP